MANCSQLPSEKPLMPLNEEMIMNEQIVGCNITLPDYTLSGQKSDISDGSIQIENIQIENIHGVLMQQAPNVHTYPSQICETLPMASECTNGANHDCVKAGRTDSQNPNSVAQLEVLQKNIFGRAMEQSDDFVESDIDSSSFCNKSVEMKETGYSQTLCNGSIENSECKSDRNKTNTVDTNKDISVLEAERSHALVSSGESSSKGMEEFIQGKESANTLVLELNSPDGNKAYKPGELINQLVEGPCIILPPSQLPVIPSYPSSHAQNQRQSTSSAYSSCGIPSLPLHTDHNEALTQDPHSDSYKTVQNENSVPPSVSTAKYASPESVSQHVSTDREITTKATPAGVSESTNKHATTAVVASATKPPAKRTPNDFIFGKVIGEGSFSTVYLAKEVSTQREFAIKVCDKMHLFRENKTHFVMREKRILMKLDHPFLIKLAYTFQDSDRLYYVLTLARNGELLGYLHKLSAFDVSCTRFYSAEIVLALEYLHGLGIIHRDLKPENILISEDMHIRITDFGTSKDLFDTTGKGNDEADPKRRNSFVGTAAYVSPEVLNNQPASFGSDLWGLGCIIYQCLSGSLPFRSGSVLPLHQQQHQHVKQQGSCRRWSVNNEYQTFQKIVKVEYDFPEGFHPDAKDLVKKLLVLEPSERLGVAMPEGIKAIKKHSFYEEIDWETLPEATPPRLMPYLPATANNPEFWGQEQRTGFDDQRLAEIITGQSADGSMSPELEELPIRILTQTENSERADKMRKQRAENKFHQFVQENLIIKQGFVDKRKGLFARKRMLLLTEGPHLYYVDAHNKVLKGEIPWSKYLRPEAKNFKIFFVHTPNRTYYLESRQPDAQDWVKQIKDVWKKYFDEDK